jgi:hypothetical protein
MRRSIAAVCLVAVALLPACSGNEPPNSLFDSSGYHVRGDKVYYLTAFPGAPAVTLDQRQTGTQGVLLG